MKVTYEAKPINSTEDKYYLPSIKIYNATTPIAIKTSSNEIAYYINNPDADIGRKMFFYSLQCNDKTIGFAEIAYLKSIKAVFIDYISFSEGEKKNSNFYPFLNIIVDSIISTGAEVNYIATEISDRNSGANIDEESRFFSRLVALEDFMILDAPYRHLKLGSNTESEFECKLFIRILGGASIINRNTYIALVKDIYYEHYLSWFMKFLGNSDNYKSYVDKEFNRLVHLINKDSDVIPLVNRNTVACEYFSADGCFYSQSTAGSGSAAKQQKQGRWWVPIIIFFICFIVAGGVYLALVQFNIDATIFIPLLAAIAALCAAGISYYSKK